MMDQIDISSRVVPVAGSGCIFLYFFPYQDPFDGIGGTCKRTTAKESLTRPLNNQIVTPLDVFHFCDERLKNIKSIWVGDEEVEALWNEKLSARFAKAKTVKGTQTFHFVEPIPGTTKVWVKEVSSDVNKFEKKTSK